MILMFCELYTRHLLEITSHFCTYTSLCSSKGNICKIAVSAGGKGEVSDFLHIFQVIILQYLQYFTVSYRFHPESGNSAGMALESAGMTRICRNSTGIA
jgi:hypothetical protein